jgi:hypothetical protein
MNTKRTSECISKLICLHIVLLRKHLNPLG